jgi:hypothetical protein
VLAQCLALAHLDLRGNSNFVAAGSESLAGVLGKCRELVYLGNGCREREASSLVAWSSLWSSSVGTVYCLLFAICLADRQQETSYTYSGSRRSYTFVQEQRSQNKRHDLYLIASLWVIATQVRASLTVLELSSVASRTNQVGRKARLNAALHLKFHKRKRWKRERWRRSSVRSERVQALAGEKREKLFGESDRAR